MQRKFITNLALLLFLNLLVKPFWIFGIDRTVQNVVGAESYGLYFALLNFSFLLNILLDGGIAIFNNINIARNNFLVGKHFQGIIALKLILGVVYAVITLLAGFFAGYTYEQFALLAFLIFNQFLSSLILYLRSNISGLHLFKTDSMLSLLDRLLMIIICSILLWGNITDTSFKVEWFIYAQTASYALTAVIAYFIVAQKAGHVSLKWDFTFFMAMLKKSLPFALLFLLMTFYYRIDAVMLERMLPDGAEQSGIYAQAYRLLDAANMIAFLFATLLLPVFARMLNNNEPVESLSELSFSMLFTGALIITSGAFLYSGEIMSLLYHEHIESTAPVFAVLMCCFPGIATTYVFGTLLTANGNLKELNIVASCGVLLNIALNIWLIPHYQAKGAAIASLITQLLVSSFHVIIAQYFFRFRVNYSLFIKLAVLLSATLLLGYYSVFFTQNWIVNLCVLSGLSLALALTIRLLNIKSFYIILKQDK